MNKLPIVKNIDGDEGIDFYFDRRLSELRAVNNPFHIIKLNEYEVYYYEHLYNEDGKKG